MDAIGFLPTFLAVCETGGFQRASERLHLSQPAVSYQIRMLERSLGVRLFARSGRGVVLTEAGSRLREFSRASLRDFDDMRKGLLGASSPRRVLRIAAVSVFGRYVLFPHLSSLHGDARLDLRFPSQEDVLQQVETGLADVGFIYEARVRSALHAEVVATEELVLIAPKRGENALRAATFTAMAKHPWVTWEEHEYVFGRWFAAAFGRQPGTLRAVAHFEEMEEVVAWVAAGRGLSIVPRDCLTASASRHVAVRSARPRCTNEILAVWRADRERADVAELVASMGGNGSPRPR